MPKKQTLEEFIKKSNIAHNFKYNYDKSIYINKQTKVIVTCPEHGDFEVTPGAHYILKSGCPECAKISRSKTKSKGLEKFIKQANLKWNSFYNYSKVNYINNYTKVEIICPIHGSFFKDPRSHIDPQRYGGCQSCSKERLSKIISKVQQQKPKGTNREAFIDYCNGIHNNKYSYDKMNYVNMMTPIEIICPIHGTFTQHPINHYQGKGCPECGKHISKSKGEIEVREYIKSIYSGEIISNDRIQLGGKELDIYLPELKLAFEYDGTYWQGKSYCLTVYSVPCKVTAIGENNIEYTLLNVSETGQYLFIAPTWKVNISQDDASIVETFNLAGISKVGGSGSGSDPTYGFLKIIFVDALPPISETKENTLYFVPKDGSDPDNYNEYIFDPVNKQFELVGQSAIDTTNFAKLSTSNIFLATNTFNEIVTFKKGLKVSESGPVITSNDTTLNLPNTSTPLLKAQSLILNGVSTFNNEIRVSTIAGLTSAPIKVTSAANFNKPIKFNDTIRIETGKIDPGGRGVTWTLGSLIETPTTADNNHHRLCATTDASNIGYIIYHDRVINGVWKKDKIIPANLWDFTWHDEASIKVKTPTKAEYAANKNYVDTQISTISQFDSSSDQTISGTWRFSKPLKITEAQLADEAVSKGYVDEAIQQNLNTTLEGVIKFVSTTEAEYKALETKSPSTIYHLTDVSMWAIGDQEIVTSNMPA